jgi:hypothetical protein
LPPFSELTLTTGLVDLYFFSLPYHEVIFAS